MERWSARSFPGDLGKLKLALISLTSLFLELVIIRWLATEVRIFSYFKSLPLFAAFLGLGVGFLIATTKRNLFRFTPILLFLSVCVIGLAARLGYTHIVFTDPFEYYFWGQCNTIADADAPGVSEKATQTNNGYA